MNGCFSHCTARGLAIVAGFALAAAPASAETIVAGSASPTPLDGGNLRSNQETTNSNDQFVPGELPAWMVDHPAAIVVNGDVIGLDGAKMGIDVNGEFAGAELDKDFLVEGCQPRAEFSFFFWGDSSLFGGAQLNPRKMADNFLPGLPESSLGANDGTPDGTAMEINGTLISAYFSKFVDGDGDGALDPDFLSVDIDAATAGDQPYALWTLRYFSDANGDGNPSTPQAVPGVPDELIASFVYPGSLADPMATLPTQPMNLTNEPNQPGGAYDFFGFGAARPTNLTFTHAPVSVVAGECYWFECAPQFNELVPGSTATLQVGLWNAGLGGDGYMWYNSGNAGFYQTGASEQGPNSDRNWCLDIDEEDPGAPGTFVNSGVNLGGILPCTNDPCFGNAPFNDDCIDALELTLDTPSPIGFSDSTCAVPVEEGEIRNPVGSSIILSEAIWWFITGNGNTFTVSSCSELNDRDEQNMNGPRRNLGINVFCGTGCGDLYFLGEVLASDDVTGVGCDGPGSCNVSFNFPSYSFPEISFPTTVGQDYYIATFDNFTPGIQQILVSDDGTASSPAADQCSVCTFDGNFFGAPTLVEVEDETDPAFPGGLGQCVSYNDDAALYEATRRNQGCQFEPDDPMAPFTPSFAFLNGVDLTPINSGEFIVSATSTYSVVINGPDFRDNDHHAFTVSQPTLVRISANGAQSSRASIQRYDWDGSDINSVTCQGAEAASDSVDSSRCDNIPDNESSVLMPGNFYSISSGINDGIDTGCAAPDRDYVMFAEFINCPEVPDLSGSADVVDNDLVAGILDPLNFDIDTDMDGTPDAASGCNPLVDYNSGCDRVVSETELYLTDFVNMDDLYFGNLGNDANNTDTDWVEFTAPAGGEVTITIDANYDFFWQLYELPIAACLDLMDTNPSTTCNFVGSAAPGVPFDGGSCDFSAPIVVTGLTAGTNYALQLSHGNIGIAGFVFDGRPCGSGYNNYTLVVSGGISPNGSCLGGFGGSYDSCVDTTRADCAANGGVFQGENNTCGMPDFALCIADQTTSNTNPGDPGNGDADGTVDGADLSFWVEQWLGGTSRGDLTTTNNNPGDAGYGVQDGTVDGADLSFFIETWLGANGGIDCIPGN